MSQTDAGRRGENPTVPVLQVRDLEVTFPSEAGPDRKSVV